MPRRTVKVEPIPGEPLRYRVESWEAPDLYHVVDLGELGGNGECDCRDYLTRCMKNWKARPGIWVLYGQPDHPDKLRTQCRHIYCARIKYTNDSLITDSQQQNPKET